MIMSIMCGHTGLNAMARFAKSHREELAEVMPEISFNQIYKAFNKWMIQYFKEENIAIDGKSINSTVSSCHDSKQNFVSLVSWPAILFGMLVN